MITREAQLFRTPLCLRCCSQTTSVDRSSLLHSDKEGGRGLFLLVSRSNHSGENRSLLLPSENKITCSRFLLDYHVKTHLYKTHNTAHLMNPPPPPPRSSYIQQQFHKLWRADFSRRMCAPGARVCLCLFWGGGGRQWFFFLFFSLHVPDDENQPRYSVVHVKLRTQCHCILRLSIPHVVVAGLDQGLGTAHPGCFVAL